MPFQASQADAAQARAFYFDLRRAGARRRPSRLHAIFMLIGWGVLAVGVPAGVLTHNDTLLAVTVGFGVVLVLLPVILYLSVPGLAAVAFRRRLDAEGWEREQEPVWRRTKRLSSGLPFLAIRYRLAPPIVAVGARWLSLRGLALESDGAVLRVRSGPDEVAKLALLDDPKR